MHLVPFDLIPLTSVKLAGMLVRHVVLPGYLYNWGMIIMKMTVSFHN